MTTWTETPAAASSFSETATPTGQYIADGYVADGYFAFDWVPGTAASTTWT